MSGTQNAVTTIEDVVDVLAGSTAQTGAHTPERPALSDMPDPLGLGAPVEGHQPEYPVGTRRIYSDGRISVKTADGWIPEARVVLEQLVMPRPMRDGESARRKRGVPPWDNRPENLQLWRDGRPSRTPRRTPLAKNQKRRRWKAEVETAEQVIEILLDCLARSMR